MAAARAADRNRQMGLALADEARQQKIDETVQLAFERLRFGDGVKKRDDFRMAAVERLQLRHVIRVRQEADVEDEIGVQWNAVLETERDHRNRHRICIRRTSHSVAEFFFKGGERERRCVDDDVRRIAHRLQLLALGDDAVDQPAAVRQRVLAARLGKTPHEYFITSVEK
jgi:hypothetical protein